jgi:RNase P subunit RPR2
MIFLYSLAGIVLGAGTFALGAWYGHQLGHVKGRLLEAENAKKVEFYRESGSVEADCRSCGQINRVPWQRLRDKPTCGKCKARLMPKARVRVAVEDPVLQSELAAVWKDYEKVWVAIADAFDRLSTIAVKPGAASRAKSQRLVN